jgi:hypothetical protein
LCDDDNENKFGEKAEIFCHWLVETVDSTDQGNEAEDAICWSNKNLKLGSLKAVKED